MPKIEFKKGDVYECFIEGNVFHSSLLTITGWDEEKGNDKTIFFKTNRKIHNRINHRARVWWFNDYCRLHNQYEIDRLTSENKALKQGIKIAQDIFEDIEYSPICEADGLAKYNKFKKALKKAEG